MPINLSRILRSDAIIEILTEEDDSLFAKLDSRGIIRGEHSKSEALRFHIKAFLDHIPPFYPIPSAAPRKLVPKKVAFSDSPAPPGTPSASGFNPQERNSEETAPEASEPKGDEPGQDEPEDNEPEDDELRKRERRIYGITTLPAIKTHKEYTCCDATQPLAIIWPSTHNDSHNRPLKPDSSPTCHTNPDSYAFRACTTRDPWITPRENPTPCQHTIWYAAIAALSNCAAEKLCRAFIKQNITTLDAPIADTSEARAIEVNILPRLLAAYSLYTARIFICGRYKKHVIHLCKQCVHRIAHASYAVLTHPRPWTLLEHWIAEVTEIYHVLETMLIWLEEAVEKMDKSVRYLAGAGAGAHKPAPEKEVMPRGEMLPLYRCLVEVRGLMRREAIKSVREDMETIKHALGRMMEVVHPLTGLGHDKAVVEALGGLWSVEGGQEKERDSAEDESDDMEDMDDSETDGDVDDSDDSEKDGDESEDCMDEDESDVTLGYDDQSDDSKNDEDDSDEDMEYGKDAGEEETAGEENDAWLASMMDPIGDGETEASSASNDDLEDEFDKEMQERRPVIHMALLDAAVEVRRVCETWRNHYVFILAIQSGFLNEIQDR